MQTPTNNVGTQPGIAPEPTALLLTVPQAAQVLAIGRSTADELIAAGDLEVVHIGRSVRVHVRALEDYVGSLRAASGVAPLRLPPQCRTGDWGDPEHPAAQDQQGLPLGRPSAYARGARLHPDVREPA